MEEQGILDPLNDCGLYTMYNVARINKALTGFVLHGIATQSVLLIITLHNNCSRQVFCCFNIQTLKLAEDVDDSYGDNEDGLNSR